MKEEHLITLNKDISDKEWKVLRGILLFMRTVRPFEVMEIKLNDNHIGELSVIVKSTTKDTYEI